MYSVISRQKKQTNKFNFKETQAKKMPKTKKLEASSDSDSGPEDVSTSLC